VIVRAETPDDYAAIRSVVDEAFGDTITGDLVEMIRASDRYVPELSLVAVSQGQSLGHVMSSYVDVVVVPGKDRVRFLQVGPLVVAPPQQLRGVGSALMEETIRLADERGEPLLLIEGNPKYYERFGFRRADEVGIEPPPEAHGPQFFMIRPLGAYDPTLRGRAVYPSETFGGVS
jgi:putative acetyltransferase